jgi:hypothetical protein
VDAAWQVLTSRTMAGERAENTAVTVRGGNYWHGEQRESRRRVEDRLQCDSERFGLWQVWCYGGRACGGVRVELGEVQAVRQL